MIHLHYSQLRLSITLIEAIKHLIVVKERLAEHKFIVMPALPDEHIATLLAIYLLRIAHDRDVFVQVLGAVHFVPLPVPHGHLERLQMHQGVTRAVKVAAAAIANN